MIEGSAFRGHGVGMLRTDSIVDCGLYSRRREVRRDALLVRRWMSHDEGKFQ